ncbi:type III secretion protein HrpB4 [Burkholderia arboris]|uniref:Type III secretion protein HrpB4 n=2 Tax=Burkholderia arboris TaxID=488730 RepID=A0A9Q9SGZ1_9BURK|nr:type III secretion protein HrpB4 [Burkholderia arboris]
MNAMTDLSYRMAAAALAAWQRNARSALQWAHPSWLAGALGIDAAAADGLARALAAPDGSADAGSGAAIRLRMRVDACSLALLRCVGLPLPDIRAVVGPGALRVDALPPATGLRVLRIRALRFRRGEIRRIVDKRMRARVAEWSGLALDRLIAEQPGKRHAIPDIEQMAGRVPVPPVTAVDGDALALEGHALIRRDLGHAHSPCPLLRLALPADAHALRAAGASPHWVDRIPADLDRHGTDALFAELPHLLPEYAWLSG